MIRIYVATYIIKFGLQLLLLAKWLHPKLFATFRVMLIEAVEGKAGS
jgi:hypothetical protein